MRRENLREIASYIAWRYLGTPYVWGGDDPSGFDCSGFCIEILKSVGLLPRQGDWTAQMLWEKFSGQQLQKPHEGCLAFWHSDGRIIHVEYCLTNDLAIGASGGGSDTQTPQDAWRQNAYIKVRPILSRRGLAGLVDPFGEMGKW